ncbi:membrane-bound PQQ-dependent dehydrogenase, glucose/quinate/shikimate family [Sphingomonas sp. ID0503]|uniref:membrane-bound PQQ-dependent dehydrogenase, glucose/quinate/shikimate family n=1 Tax=Sphingomonas sp. ID0503 TaxID=3399691 RepID=UPI003AFB7766
MSRNQSGAGIAPKALAVPLLLIGFAIAAGGAMLVTLGGSLYYLLGGVAVVAAAVLLWRRHGASGWLYAGFLLATLAWALWEAGLGGWALAPRLLGPAVFGLLFALPGVRRAIGPSGWAAAGAAILLIAVQVVAGSIGSPDRFVAPASPALLAGDAPAAGAEWAAWGGTNAGQRYSGLDQITPANVGDLELAWTYHTGVKQEGVKSPLQTTPIMVGDTLYACTQTNIVVALDPETGREKWRFDPKVDATGASAVTTCRGVAFARLADAVDCPERIITATFNAKLIALDARSGEPCPSFGKGGFVDLTTGLGVVDKGFYYVSSAPTIVRGRIVLGGWVADNQSTDEPSGVIRAYDVATGTFAWAWDMGRPDFHGEPGAGEHYTRSTPNSWAPMSADEALGLVYVPTGNATPDHWGANRSPASERFGSSVIALDAQTGAMRWSFQTAHHDLWDYDVASQPTLIDVPAGGRIIPALAQPTKRGELFLLDRRTGKPVAAVEERPAPQRGAAPGERLAKTQPFSVGMPSFRGPPLTETDMWGLTPLDQLWCRIRFKQLRYDGPATPPGTDESLIYPSIGGGMNWGGVSVDPRRGLMIVNSIYYGTIAQLVPRAETDRLHAAAAGQMHNFSLPQPQKGTPYGVLLTGLVSPLNVPCNTPPFGKISAIDLRTRKLVWSRPIGSARDSGPMGFASRLPIGMGMPMFGGSMVTKSGLIFIGATQERAFRAFDVSNGHELWRTALPAGGQANPMTYVSPKSGRQFVLIAAGGHVMLQSPLGDSIVAYALPKKR